MGAKLTRLLTVVVVEKRLHKLCKLTSYVYRITQKLKYFSIYILALNIKKLIIKKKKNFPVDLPAETGFLRNFLRHF
jgi:hypothetical protein